MVATACERYYVTLGEVIKQELWPVTAIKWKIAVHGGIHAPRGRTQRYSLKVVISELPRRGRYSRSLSETVPVGSKKFEICVKV